MNAFRAWASVHASRTGAVMVVATGALTFVVGGHGIEAWGPIRLPGVVPWSQLLPLLAAAGVAAALSYQVEPTILIDERALARVRRARGPWALMVTGAAALACSAGALRDLAGTPAALVNLLLLSGIAISVVALGAPELAWLPPSALFLAAALFGYPEGAGGDEYYWWAALFSPTVGPWRLAGAAATWTAAVVLYSVALPYSRQARRPSLGA